MSTFAVGIDLGGTMIKAALIEQRQGLIREVALETQADQGVDVVLDRITGAIREVAPDGSEQHIEGIGVGAPGVINWERTAVMYPPNLPGWEIVDLREELCRRLDRETLVFVENDANLAGLGSAYYGAGEPYDSFIMVTLGTGVGGAIIYQNHIFRGTSGAAGEIGHVTIDFEGPVDRYGIAGAIEAYLGQRFLSRYARHRLLSERKSLVHEMAGADLIDLTPLMLFEAATAGDEPAREVLAWAGHKLGCVLASAVTLLDIRKVIVGGGMSAAADFIFPAARASLRRYVMPEHRDEVDIIQETLGNQVGMLGAARLVFEYLDEHASSPGHSS